MFACDLDMPFIVFSGVFHIYVRGLVIFVFCERTGIATHCMAINVSVHYNGGLLPDIILLTQCYFHRGTRSNAAIKRFCICSL